MVYLDATVYLFDSNNNFVELVDYSESSDASGVSGNFGSNYTYYFFRQFNTVEMLSIITKRVESIQFKLIWNCCLKK
jgi:hypothetical protein